MGKGSDPDGDSVGGEGGVEKVQCGGMQTIYVEAEKGDFTEACAYLDHDDVTSPWDGQLQPIVRI